MNAPELGKLLLRITVAALLLLHGIHKLQTGIGGLAAGVVAHGLPHWFAYGVYIGEVAAPLAVLLGIWTRPAALAMAFNMAVALWVAHRAELAQLGKAGGWAVELPVLYLVGALAIALFGAGRFSVSRGAGRFD